MTEEEYQFLRRLATKLEKAAEGRARTLDCLIHDHFGFTDERHCKSWCNQDGRRDLTRESYLSAWAEDFTSSFDDARALFWKLLPRGHGYDVYECHQDLTRRASARVYSYDDEYVSSATGATPALALCCAAIRAKAQKDYAPGAPQ